MRTHCLLTTGLTVLAAAILTAQDAARFSARSELVVLQAAVTDTRGGMVRGLPARAFRVLEDGRPQAVTFFAEQDAPATIGLLLDASGSMMENQDRVIAGVTTFAEASHPDDEFLPLVFNERVTSVLPAGTRFTDNRGELRDALTRGSLNVRGRTAFHDAVAEALADLGHGRHERRVLIVLSDGGDNASRLTFDDLLERVLASNVVIYTIALLDPLTLDHNPKALRRLAEASGGLAFRPGDTETVGRVFRSIAGDIRSRYTLAYAPDDTVLDGRLRRVRVTVKAPGHAGLRVRTRAGYVALVPPGAEGAEVDK
jgi:Ca-activated chloride channel family protein